MPADEYRVQGGAEAEVLIPFRHPASLSLIVTFVIACTSGVATMIGTNGSVTVSGAAKFVTEYKLGIHYDFGL